MNNVAIDITHIPFSRYGAYLSVTRDERSRELIIHSARRRFHESPFFSLSFGCDEAQDFTCTADPSVLSVENEHGSARIYIRDDDTVVIESLGLDVCLCLHQNSWGYGTMTGERTLRLIVPEKSLQTTMTIPCGTPVLDGPVNRSIGDLTRNHRTNLTVTCEGGRVLMALAITNKEPKRISLPILPEEEILAIYAEWEEFLAKMPAVPAATTKAAEFARVTWYNLWSSFVRAADCYTADTMLMAKKQMTSTWSWDHCFNALAMAGLTNQTDAKRVAMDQFYAPFALQPACGTLPDLWNPDLETRWAVTKPPIHGWCFGKLMDAFDFTSGELEDVYGKLTKWTRWWTEYNDTDGDGIPDYPRGCDSGWDNSTLFDGGFFVETPDLPAFLILQMNTLSRIAAALHRPEDAACWKDEAEAMLTRLIDHSWTGERFVAKLSRTHEYEEQPTSLLALMPLVLGDLLPAHIRKKLVAILERDFLTENGLATEMPASPQYNPDGYWRGPIWAPTTYLLVDGLRRGGYDDLAREIAFRYCRMSCERAEGNYENFDALAGIGRRAPGYTWAASVYMMLLWEYGC